MADPTYSFLPQTDAASVQAGNPISSSQFHVNNTGSAFPPPNTSAPVPTSTITAPATNYPPATPTDNGAGLVNGAAVTNQPAPQPAQPSLLDQAANSTDYTQDPNYQAAQGQYNQSVSNYQNAQQPNQADLQSSAETANGVPDIQKQLSDINTRLASKNAEYQTLDEAIRNQPIMNVIANRQQAQAQRQQAIDIGALSAQQAAAQKNYDLAESRATQTANLKFSDAQAKIDRLKEFITINQNNMTSAEKNSVAKLQAQATKAQGQLDTQKAATAFAMTNNVTQPFYNIGGTIYRTSDGKPYSTPQDFYKDGGAIDFGDVQVIDGTQGQSKSMIVDLANKYPDAKISLSDSLGAAQQKVLSSKIYQQATRLSSGGSGSSSGSSSVSTAKGSGVVAGQQVPPNIAGDVENVLSGKNTLYNIRQTMGRTNQAAAYMQQMRDSIRAVDPNFDFVASDAGGKFVSSTYYQKSVAAINSAMPNIDKVVQLSDQVSRVGVKGVDAILQKANMQIGNKAVSNFHEAQKLIADEIGLALGQGTVSDMKLQLGFDVTDPSVSPEVFASNMGIVKDFISNRLQGLQQQRYSSSTSNSSSNNTPSVPGGTTVNYQGKNYLVDAQGNMTAQP